MGILEKLLATDNSTAALAARLALGIAMFPHGAQKALGWFGGGGIAKTVEGLSANFGVPAVFAVLVIAAEFLGSLGLIVGLGTRVAAVGIGATMVGAVALLHGSNGFFMNWYGNQAGEGYEYHILAIGLAVALTIGGAGRWSLDRVLARRLGSGE